MIKKYGDRYINLQFVTHFGPTHFSDGGEQLLNVSLISGVPIFLNLSFEEELRKDMEDFIESE